MKKIVINTCYGGFGLSDAAYEKLHEWGVPIQKYINQERDSVTKLYINQPANDGEVIFDRAMTPLGECNFNDTYWKYKNSCFQSRYWDCWTGENREHPLIVRLVKEMKKMANGKCAELKVIEVPDGVEYEIDEYDGIEHVAEKHRTWT